MKYFSIIILILSFTLTSCWKEIDDTNKDCVSDCTIMSGKIVSDFSGTGVSGVTLDFDRTVRGPFGEGYHRDIKKFTTDKKGKFEFEFYVTDHEIEYPGYGIKIISTPEEYINLDSSFYIGGASTNKRDTAIYVELLLPKKAYLKAKFMNTKEEKSLNIICNFGQFDSTWNRLMSTWYADELYWDTITNEKLYLVCGNLYNHYSSHRTRVDGADIFLYEDSIYVPAGDTILMEVNSE